MAVSAKTDYVSITDHGTPALLALVAELGPQRLGPKIGAGGKVLFQKHFIARPTNKAGFPSSGFYAQAARATSFRPEPDGVTITVAHVGIRQRLQGGVIRPTKGKQFLKVPARAAAYGKRAGEFNSLRFGFALDVASGRMRPALVEAQATEIQIGRQRVDGTRSVTANQSRTGLVPFFWLIRQANQAADPTVIPSREEVLTMATGVIESAVDRARKRNGGGNT